MKHLIFVFIFLTSCMPNDLEYLDPDLAQYYRNFQIEADRLNINLPDKSIMLIFEELDTERAHCHTGKRSIKICVNSNFFSVEPGIYDYKLEATLFHEFGHGFLNRDHIEPINGIETSLMTVPGMREDWINGVKREYYLKELFGM